MNSSRGFAVAADSRPVGRSLDSGRGRLARATRPGVNVLDTPGGDPSAGRRRSLLALAFVSQGIPLVRSGDELAAAGAASAGPLDWGRLDATMVEFIRRLAAVRRRQPLLQRRESFAHRRLHGPGGSDTTWFHPDGRPITEAEWPATGAAAVVVLIVSLVPARRRLPVMSG